MASKEIIATVRNDSVAVLFESDSLAPERYWEVFQSRQISPEKRLMIAVLDDAVQSFFAGIGRRKSGDLRHFREAEEWIMDSRGDQAFSFDWICNLLGLDPAYLRSGLEKMRAEARVEQRSCPSKGRPSRGRGTSSRRSTARTKRTGFHAEFSQRRPSRA